MFNLDFPISCSNRIKNVQSVIIHNTGTNPRDCIMAVSGAAMPVFTGTSSPVTCSNGTNGSASITVVGGIAPYSYTFATTPPQTGPIINGLAVGIYSYTATDAGTCAISSTIAVTQSLTPQPPIQVSTNYTAVCLGSPVTMAVSGAVTYTWNNGSNLSLVTYTPTGSTTYTVAGITSANCFITGSISILVNPVPNLTFSTPGSLCINAPNLQLSATPSGGIYAGNGVGIGGIFHPVTAGVGTKTVSYTFTDANNCTSVSVSTIVVNALPVLTFTASQNPLCLNSSPLTLTATPSGGTYVGNGVTGSALSPTIAGVGTTTISYSYTDANNCTSTISSSVVINSLPSVSITTTKKLFCKNSPSLFLNAVPSGGTYSGTGVTPNAAFSPSLAGVGNQTISYSYTDGNNCTVVSAIVMTVSTCSGINQVDQENLNYVIYPNPNNGSFTIKSVYDIELTIINEIGQTVKFVTLDENNNRQLTIESIAAGVYFVTGQTNNSSVKQKIIVTK